MLPTAYTCAAGMCNRFDAEMTVWFVRAPDISLLLSTRIRTCLPMIHHPRVFFMFILRI